MNETSTKLVTLNSKQGRVGVFECASDERLLYAGLRAGMPLPHECATGTCGTCKAKVLSGDIAVAWPEAPGLKYVKPGSNEVLLCQSYARTDCSFMVRGAPGLDVDAPNLPSYFRGYVNRSGMLTQDVVILEVTLDRPMNFVAGQFVLLEAEDVQGFRAYSMVNEGGSTDALELIVKRKPGGRLTDFIFGRDIGGLRFKVLGPLGRATFEFGDGAGDLICAAGGTGIAGLMSVLARASRSGHLDRHAAFVYFGVRTGTDLFFLDRLAALKRRHPDSARVVVATSEEAASACIQAAYPTLMFVQGFVHEALDRGDLSECVQPMAYLAGPVPAVEASTGVLLTRHRIRPDRIKFDRFG